MGNAGKLPWGRSMVADRVRYHDIIRGKNVVMGAGTYNAKSQENELANRIYVLSRREIELSPRAELVKDINSVLSIGKTEEELVVAGGGQVFAQLLPHADKLYLTYIDAELEGTVYFPEFDEADWEKVEDEAFVKDDQNPYDYRFVTLLRK